MSVAFLLPSFLVTATAGLCISTMSSTDSLAILESQRLSAGGDDIGESNDISGSGLLNSDTYRSRIDDVLRSDPLPDNAWFTLRAMVMYRPKISRVLQIVGALVKADGSSENKRMLSMVTQWIQKHMADHSNVAPNVIPIHAMNQAGAPVNFGIFVRLTANLSNIQFLFSLLAQRWSCQLRIATDSYMYTHRELQRRWWDRKVRKSTRDPATYSQSSSGFQAGFVEEFYNTTASDSYLILVDGTTFDGSMLGNSNFSGYSLFDLLKIREEHLLRIPTATKMFEAESLSAIPEVFENIVELSNDQFRGELDMLYPNKMVGRIIGKKATSVLTEDESTILKDMGLMSVTKGKRYLDERIKIGALKGVSLSACERTHLFPTFSNDTLTRALAAKDEEEKKPEEPKEDVSTTTGAEPPFKKPKTATEVALSFALSEDMEERIKVAAGKVKATADALREWKEKGVDANIAQVLDDEQVETLGCAVANSAAYKSGPQEGTDVDKSAKIAGFIATLDYNDAIELLKSL